MVKTFEGEIKEESEWQEEEAEDATSRQNVPKYSVHRYQVNVVCAT